MPKRKTPEEKRDARICALFAQMGDPNKPVADGAYVKLLKFLAEHKLSFNDGLEIVGVAAVASKKQPPPPPPPPTEPPSFGINVFDLVEALFKRLAFQTADDRLICSLWCLHSWVYEQFEYTPRLVDISPIPESGKTRLLKILNELCREPFFAFGITAPGLYHRLRENPLTSFLLDEGDNYDLGSNFRLRRVFNSGYERLGAESVFLDGRAQLLPTFAPLALAAIGTLYPPQMSRSFLIRMRRAPRHIRFPSLSSSASDFQATREEIRRWAATCKLNPDPDIPDALRPGRPTDNARVLLAIADDLGCGERARAAIVAHYAARSHENILEDLLIGIQTVFMSLHVDRITRTSLVRELLGLEDGQWRDWCGLDGSKPPHPLNGPELSRILHDMFEIRLKNIWPIGPRLPTTKSEPGYHQSQLEAVWEDYLGAGAKPSNVIGLPRP